MAAILERAKERRRHRQADADAEEPCRPAQIDLNSECDADVLRALEDSTDSDSLDDFEELAKLEEMQLSDDADGLDDTDNLDMSLDRTLNQLDRESEWLLYTLASHLGNSKGRSSISAVDHSQTRIKHIQLLQACMNTCVNRAIT